MFVTRRWDLRWPAGFSNVSRW